MVPITASIKVRTQGHCRHEFLWKPKRCSIPSWSAKGLLLCTCCDFLWFWLGWSMNALTVRGNEPKQHSTHTSIRRNSSHQSLFACRGSFCVLGFPCLVFQPFIPMTDQDVLPTLTATFPLWRDIMIREGIEIVHTHQATSVMANESVVYAAAMGLPSIYTDHSLFQFDDIAGVVLNRVSTSVGGRMMGGPEGASYGHHQPHPLTFIMCPLT